MRNVLVIAFVAFLCAGCTEGKRIDFIYFNLSKSEIVVDSIAGLPQWVAPGVLVPVHAEDRLSEARATAFDETIQVPSTLRIKWQEGGVTRRADLKRDEVGIRAKIKKGTIRFTYLGSDRWRVKATEESQ